MFRSPPRLHSILRMIILMIPFLCMLGVWLSPLSFVPVPWPDDSAFYFVAKYFFHWPPQWVMIPQSPFEPTYRIFNFNTMPLFPILIGLGRFVGIDGPFGIKFWSLLPWAVSGSLGAWVILRKLSAREALIPATLIALAFGLDPILRWSSVIVRPESLIALFGMTLVLILSNSISPSPRLQKYLARKGVYDPIAALLALSAYAHFNAIHLLFPVIITVLVRFTRPIRELYAIGWRTAILLAPWALVVLSKFDLFLHQMGTQWKRLAVPNDWLFSFHSAIRGLFQDMGSPIPWSPLWVTASSIVLWFFIFVSMAVVLTALAKTAQKRLQKRLSHLAIKNVSPDPTLEHRRNFKWDTFTPAAAWVLSSVWLWDNKPEVWFTSYIHWSILTFWVVIFTHPASVNRIARRLCFASVGAICFFFLLIQVNQFRALSAETSWNRNTYYGWVDCIDRELSKLEQSTATSRSGPFQVWGPTFPDILVELSLRHPEWEFTRTNDFHDRQPLALRHGEAVDAMVVTETISPEERSIDGPAAEYPEVRSLWMNWPAYYLHRFNQKPNWKTHRHLCQKGRWQAFLFMNQSAR